jgi:hypothetical protein
MADRAVTGTLMGIGVKGRMKDGVSRTETDESKDSCTVRVVCVSLDKGRRRERYGWRKTEGVKPHVVLRATSDSAEL